MPSIPKWSDPRYLTVMSGEKLHPRGFTPFQFSSRRLQINTTQLGGVVPNNPFSSLLNESTTWYEMWINPEKINLSRQFQVREQHTAGSIVAYHYRPQTTRMNVSGVVGWIGLNPQEEDKSMFNFVDVSGKGKVSFQDKGKNKNSPRVFMRRLRELAEDPAYFIGTDGVEHYNTKFIKIYTKQYPRGMLCEGYFTKFDVPESGEDSQTINYSFEFVVESMKPITQLQKVAGMFGGKSSASIGSSIRTIPGLG